ncbi:MAG: class I SAM-dependent methyltransferase [Hyphomicrobiales bacterium]|nr:class I SAM-dependent methyltransferase [Hyphomicrobiales bacterium]
MSVLARLITLAERAPPPDFVTRAAISAFVADTARRLARLEPDAEAQFLEDMARLPIALHVAAANTQHYEVPAAFFETVLGARRKYSCCYYASPESTLDEAETEALKQTVERAEIRDGMHILELGCGWGSLSLYMAEKFPNAHILAVSNSNTQRQTIDALARRRGLQNLQVVTADMNVFDTVRRFDRIVSVEMFEHMANWRALLGRCLSWLTAEGRLFLHVFTHANGAYRFDHADQTNWIAQHFFTGGMMPSHALPKHFPDLFSVERDWRWSGDHYARTARDWLARFDDAESEIETILRPVYGAQTRLWMTRWRWFFLATEGLFGHAGGSVWGVGHYLMRPSHAG